MTFKASLRRFSSGVLRTASPTKHDLLLPPTTVSTLLLLPVVWPGAAHRPFALWRVCDMWAEAASWIGRNFPQRPWMTYHLVYPHLQLWRFSLHSSPGLAGECTWRAWECAGVFLLTPLGGLLRASFFGLQVTDTSLFIETLTGSTGRSGDHRIKRPSCCNVNILECFAVPLTKPVYCFKDK